MRHFDLYIEALIGYARAFLRWQARNQPSTTPAAPPA